MEKFHTLGKTPSAYTLGRTSSYDEGLLDGKGLYKLGAYGPTPDEPEGYIGGWVFQTITEAIEFKKTLHDYDWDPKDFSVYEIKLPNNWETDVSKAPGKDGVHNLLVDALILRKVNNDSC